MNEEQPDLFTWAETRQSAEVINFIPYVVRQIVRQRRQARIERTGDLIDMPPRPQPDIPKRRIA